MSELTEVTRRKIEDLTLQAARLIDSDRLEELPSLFLENGVYKVASRFNVERGLPAAQINCTNRRMIADRIMSLRKANVYQPHHYRHVVSSVLVDQGEGGVYHAYSTYMVVRIYYDEGGFHLFSSGEYRDKIVINNGVAQFQERVVVFDSKSIDTLLVIPL